MNRTTFSKHHPELTTPGLVALLLGLASAGCGLVGLVRWTYDLFMAERGTGKGLVSLGSALAIGLFCGGVGLLVARLARQPIPGRFALAGLGVNGLALVLALLAFAAAVAGR